MLISVQKTKSSVLFSFIWFNVREIRLLLTRLMINLFFYLLFHWPDLLYQPNIFTLFIGRIRMKKKSLSTKLKERKLFDKCWVNYGFNFYPFLLHVLIKSDNYQWYSG